LKTKKKASGGKRSARLYVRNSGGNTEFSAAVGGGGENHKLSPGCSVAKKSVRRRGRMGNMNTKARKREETGRRLFRPNKNKQLLKERESDEREAGARESGAQGRVNRERVKKDALNLVGSLLKEERKFLVEERV